MLLPAYSLQTATALDVVFAQHSAGARLRHSPDEAAATDIVDSPLLFAAPDGEPRLYGRRAAIDDEDESLFCHL